MLANIVDSLEEFVIQCNMRGLTHFYLDKCYDERGVTHSYSELSPFQKEIESFSKVFDLNDSPFPTLGLGFHFHYCIVNINELVNHIDSSEFQVQGIPYSGYCILICKDDPTLKNGEYRKVISLAVLDDDMINRVDEGFKSMQQNRPYCKESMDKVIQGLRELANENRRGIQS